MVECTDEDQIIKLDSMQVPSVMIHGGELLDFTVSEMEGIKHVNIELFLWPSRGVYWKT